MKNKKSFWHRRGERELALLTLPRSRPWFSVHCPVEFPLRLWKEDTLISITVILHVSPESSCDGNLTPKFMLVIFGSGALGR